MPQTPKEGINRRTFVAGAGGMMLVTSMSAKSYARVLGANDRIHIGQLGCGNRSQGHVHMVQLASKQMPVETVAVCDLWTLAREHRAAQVKRVFDLEPQSYKYSEEMLANKDIDGVMIATGDFQHAKLCTEVVRAGKDCYVEKPFANVLSEAIEARNTVKRSKQIVQMGSQHRSQPYQLAVRDIVRSGRIGSIVHIEQEWNVNEERWRWNPMDTGDSREWLMDINMEWKQWLYSRPSQLREEDTDWKRWLLGKPNRPFDPHVYLEFRLYKEFSAGIFDQWLSHGSDLVHLWTDEAYPESVVANGGVFIWKDGRENPDTCVAAAVYPKVRSPPPRDGHAHSDEYPGRNRRHGRRRARRVQDLLAIARDGRRAIKHGSAGIERRGRRRDETREMAPARSIQLAALFMAWAQIPRAPDLSAGAPSIRKSRSIRLER